MRPTHDTRSIGDPIRNLEEEDAPLRAGGRGVTLRDLVAEAAATIRAELTTHELGRTIHAHPTFSESWMEAAHALHGECIHAPPKRKYSVESRLRLDL